MRFQVPQFIEQESKIVGPLTLKQFGWLGLGTFIIFISFVIFPFFVFVIISILTLILSVALAFMKVNGMPLANYLAKFFNYLLSPKQYKYKQK